MRIFDKLFVIEAARRALMEDSNVLLGYVFGSYASDYITPLSDIDVAVLLKRFGLARIGDLWSRLAEAFGVSEDSVDLVDLSRVGITLRSRILRHGVKIVDRENCERRLLEEALAAYSDVRLMTHGIIKEALNGGSLDEAAIESKLGLLIGYVAVVERIVKRGKREVSDDEVLRGALERYMQLSVESIMDVCKHFVSALRLGFPETYKGLVELLVSKGMLPNALGSDLKEYVALRNILVHRYSDVEFETLYAKALGLRELADEFAKKVRASLGKV